MKKLILTLLVAVFGTFFLHAQINTGFEESCSNYSNSFFLGCIPSWQATHGTPDTDDHSGSPSFPPAYEGLRYAHMYVSYQTCPQGNGNYQGEGIILNQDFQPGNTYSISFYVRKGNTIGQLRLLLVNGMLNVDGTGSTSSPSGPCDDLDVVPPIPEDHMDVATYANSAISSTAWTLKTVTFTPTKKYSQLWFRPLAQALSGTSSHVYIDAFGSKECKAIDYTPSICKLENSHISITTTNAYTGGVTSGDGVWKLYHAVACNGSTADSNLGAEETINWTSTNNLLIPYNTGCYVLEVTIPASGGCPAQTIRKFINTAYGDAEQALYGAFSYKANCDPNAASYSVTLTPFSTNGYIHFWYLYNGPTLIDVAVVTGGSPVVFSGLVNGIEYTVTHFVMGIEGSPYCYMSFTAKAKFGCEIEKRPAAGWGESDTTLEPGDASIADRFTPTAQTAVASASLAPNPMQNDQTVLYFGTNQSGVNEVLLLDMNGRVVRQYHAVTDASLTIERGNLPAGVYLVNIADQLGNKQNLRLILP